MNVFQKAWKRLLEAGSFYRYLLVGVGTSLLDFSLFSLLSVVAECHLNDYHRMRELLD